MTTTDARGIIVPAFIDDVDGIDGETQCQLRNKFTIWFHKLYDRNWDLSSFLKVGNLSDVPSFWGFYNNLPDVFSGMYFLMREDIVPLWENESNIAGGYISFKIDNKDLQDAWLEIMMSYIGGYITNSTENLSYINGISISPKKFYGIIKLWINSEENIITMDENKFVVNENFLKNDIKHFNNESVLYQRNSEKS